MKNTRKTLLAILLTAAMILSLMPMSTTLAGANNRSVPNGGVTFPDQATNAAAIMGGRPQGAPFDIAEALQILRYVVDLSSIIKPGGQFDANAYWEWQYMNPGSEIIEIADALQILRSVISLSSDATRRLCNRNPFTGGAGCGTRPTWVAFNVGVDTTVNPTGNGWYTTANTCACTGEGGTTVAGATTLSPPTLGLGPQNNFSQSTTVGGGTDGAVTFDRGNLPSWVTLSVNGNTLTATGTPPEGYAGGNYTVSVTRGSGTPTNLGIAIAAAPGSDIPTTTPTGGTTETPPTTTPTSGGTGDIPTTTPTSGGTGDVPTTTPTTTASTPGSTTTAQTTPSQVTTTITGNGTTITGPCRNVAAPAPAAAALGACRAAASENICGECGYCQPCDWHWFGVNQCKGCNIGSDCAARLGRNFCAVCLNCASDCSCGTVNRHGPNQATGTCRYCQTGGRAVCGTCSECFQCLYERPAWDTTQDPWGIVICAACGNCGNCKSIVGGATGRPC